MPYYEKIFKVPPDFWQTGGFQSVISQTSSICITWKLARNANVHILSQTTSRETYGGWGYAICVLYLWLEDIEFSTRLKYRNASGISENFIQAYRSECVLVHALHVLFLSAFPTLLGTCCLFFCSSGEVGSKHRWLVSIWARLRVLIIISKSVILTIVEQEDLEKNEWF